MGNTIRREPINFRIPASPDYKYLNLTEFGGLQQTDNPFTAKINTASDTLNVYVDEQNTLTTRPRVANKIDFSKIEGAVVASYTLNNKTYMKIKTGEFVNLIDDAGNVFSTANGVTFNENDFSILNYNGTLILLDGAQILVCENGEWVFAKDWTNLPIPLTTVNKNETNPLGITNESFNVLTPKHRESYSIMSIKTDYDTVPVTKTELSTNYIASEITQRKGSLYKNGYVEKIYTMPDFAQAVSLYDDGSFTYYDNDGNLKLCETKGTSVTTTDTNITHTDLRSVFGYGRQYANSKTLRNFIVLRMGDTTSKDYYRVTETSTKGKFSVREMVSPESIDLFCYSPSGNYYWLCTEDNKITKYYGVDSAAGEVSDQTLDSSLRVIDVLCDDSDVLYIKTVDSSNNKTIIYKWGSDDSFAEFISYDGTEQKTMKLSRETNELYLNGFKKKVLTTEETPTIKTLNFSDKFSQAISYSGDVFYSTDDRNGDWRLYFSSVPTENKTTSLLYDNTQAGNAEDMVFTAKNENYIVVGIYVYFQSLYSTEALYEVLYEKQQTKEPKLELTRHLLFDNTFWFYSTQSNIVRWNLGDNPLFIPENNYDEVGDEKPLTNALIISENTLGLFKKDKTYVATPTTITDVYTYLFTELTNDYGCYSSRGAVISPLRNIPIVVGLNEISGLYSSENISKVNRYYSSLSLNIDKLYRKTDNKNNRYFKPDQVWAATIKYWCVFACNYENGSRWLIFDDRTSDWFYWEIPAQVNNMWSDGDKLYFLSNKDKKIRVFETTDIIHPQNPDLTEYYDLDRKLIKWHWRSQILPLGTINYYKKLIDTTFIVADTEANDSYALNYTFRAYRKNISESDLNTIKNDLQYVQSVTKKTLISRFNFLQFEISQTEDNDQLNNNKLRLVGMALKYVLLGGIMQ